MKAIKKILQYLHKHALRLALKDAQIAYSKNRIRRSEQAMAQSQKNLRIIVDSIPESVFIKDMQGHYLFVNKNFASLFGLHPKEMIHRTFAEIMPGSPLNDELEQYDKNVCNSNNEQSVPELNFTDAYGNRRIFKMSKMPYIMPGKNIKAILGIAQDITEDRLQEAERNKMIDEIINRNKNLEQFSYIISHNLRAPVANMIGIMNELEEGVKSKTIRKILFNELFESVKRIDVIIAELNAHLHADGQEDMEIFMPETANK